MATLLQACLNPCLAGADRRQEDHRHAISGPGGGLYGTPSPARSGQGGFPPASKLSNQTHRSSVDQTPCGRKSNAHPAQPSTGGTCSWTQTAIARDSWTVASTQKARPLENGMPPKAIGG